MSLPDTAIGAKNTGRQQIAFFWGLAGCNMEGKIAIVNIEIRVIEVIGASFFMLTSLISNLVMCLMHILLFFMLYYRYSRFQLLVTMV
ncbi:MAG: hypothetical protein WCF06_15565 [Nitrososphaeraceae archaeon]